MFKRLFDLSVSGLGLIVLFPLFLALSILVKLSSPGPIFYKALRVGRNGKPFNLFKFRSMIVNADRMGPGVTGTSDARITSGGRFLRRTKLDELPQLLNVLRGEMSIVGPRPEDPRYVALYNYEQRKVLKVRPGITSPASVAYRNEEVLLTGSEWESTYITKIMPAKLVIDLEYIQNVSVAKDISVILATIRAIFKS